ncbi:MAG TPA: host-nuclease inhibitor Gam family protein [Clostridia bacterium]|nr:host-nuclease inhibitor Gam family protein [Clostridia bacterium]
MARQKVKSEPALSSWQEVDGALRQIAECQNLIDEQEIEMNRQINEVKDNTELMTRPMREKVKVLEQHIKEFVDNHRAELGGKNKLLTFGKVGYRLSSKLMIPHAADVLRRLRELGLNDCIIVKESINKEAVKRLPTEQILQAGAYVKQSDEFGYEIDRAALNASVE